MNDLIAVEKIAQWQKLKALVLDSVSSPITKRVYNMALDEFMDWFNQASRPGFTKATVSAWRVSLEARGLGSSSIHHPDVRHSQAGCGGIRQWATRARVGSRNRSREERQIRRHPRRQLVIATAGPDAPQRAGYCDCEGSARSCHPSRPPRLRPPAV
jgi:hypothetical protein